MGEIKIGPSSGDIDRGIKVKTPKRILYQELSQISDKSRDREDIPSKAVKEGLKRKGEEIHNSGK
jgi:hypothetical protein